MFLNIVPTNYFWPNGEDDHLVLKVSHTYAHTLYLNLNFLLTKAIFISIIIIKVQSFFPLFFYLDLYLIKNAKIPFFINGESEFQNQNHQQTPKSRNPITQFVAPIHPMSQLQPTWAFRALCHFWHKGDEKTHGWS